jgi:D-glycero-D-manno-heptose 1,7-bisphosphate phosphatase
VKFALEPILDRDVSDLPNFPKGVVVFDRDGTLVEDAGQHNDPNRLVFRPGVIETITLLNTLGYGIAVASNQSGLESEKFTLSILANFNEEMKRQVSKNCAAKIHLIALCPHLPISNCDCRKPKPGLLNAIEEAGLGKVKLFVGNTDSDQYAAALYNIEYMDVNSHNFTTDILDWAKR